MTVASFVRLALLLLLALLPAASGGQPAATPEKRVALVIGIGAYQNAPVLANPVNDARALGEALRRLDFEVEEVYDTDFRRLTRAIREFGIRAQRADVAVVYYAGHGVQVGRENYLLPADARLERERDLLYEAMPLELLLGEAAQARKLGIVLLDACRNNPFVDRMTRSMTVAGRGSSSPGLARVDNVPRNTMVVMATKADQVAEDGSGDHSPFAAALLAHFQLPGLELSLFFRSVRDTVLRSTGNRQEPFIFSSLGAEPFYFHPRPPNRPPVLAEAPALEVRDTAGPTPLTLTRPTDPDQDPLTVRITGLPRSGEVRVEGRLVTPGAVFNADRFATATYKPDGTMLGPVGTLDVLVEDGRGGSVMGSLAISVVPSNRPPMAEAPRRLRLYTGALEIAPPTDPDGDPLAITIRTLPRGLLRNGNATLRVGERLTPQALAGLTYLPEPGFTGAAGALAYVVEDGRGGRAEGTLDLDVMDAAEGAAQMAENALWERLRATGRPEDLNAFLLLYPDSRFAEPARRRRQDLANQASGAPGGTAPPAGPALAMTQQPEATGPGTAVKTPGGNAAPGGMPPRPASPPPVAESRPTAPAPQPGVAPRPAMPAPQPGPTAARPGQPQPGSAPPANTAQPGPATPASPDRLASLGPVMGPGASRASPPAEAPPGPTAMLSPPVMAPAPGSNERYFQDCPTCPWMVRLPGGSFMMGQGARDPAALPVRRVGIAAFALGQYPVTVGDWQACLADGGCGPAPRMAVAEENTPIHNVSWDDAQRYIAWLARVTGKPYRLPSEAEWEYAARANTTTRYWWGDNPGLAQANCADCGGPQNPRAPLPVDAFAPNGFGLYGMLGGVAQWVQDCWVANYNGAPNDGSAREVRGCMKRVLRGGSYRTPQAEILPVARNNYDAPVRYLANGFRVARALE